MSDDLERLQAQFEEFQSRIQRLDDQFGNLENMQAELGNIEAAATSGDQTVTVTAGPGGAVTNIQLTNDALKQSPDTLASSLLSTLQRAVADAARQQTSLVDEHMGSSGFDATEQVLDAQAQLFGTSPEQLRSEMADAKARAAPAPEEEIHEDYSQESILGSGDTRSEPGGSPRQGQSDSAGDEFLKNLFNDEDDHR